MAQAYLTPEITTSNARPQDIDTDLLIVPIPDVDRADAGPYDRAVDYELTRATDRGAFTGSLGDPLLLRVTESGWRATWILFVGTGHRSALGPERVRRVAQVAGAAARKQRCARLAWVDIDTPATGATSRIELAVEGFTLANFDGGVHKTQQPEPFFYSSVTVLSSASHASAAASFGRVVGESANAARHLINEPGNYLRPADLAEKAAALAAHEGVTIDILDQRRIEEQGMGLLLGVARGSIEPPRVLVARYDPAGASPDVTLGLVGKGITFDTGGISIKPADGMERMKDDMAGGATVIAALRTIARANLPVRVVAVVPCTENMPGGRATKPGDVLRAASGLTVEVNNTDAEGRLILGDGLWFARQLGATHLVDVATLTGACVVALGKITTALFGTPQPWVDRVRSAAEQAGEKVWPMPLFDEYREQLKSEIADMINSPGRPAGAVTAAMFLKEFAGSGPWAHLDIAGTAWADESKAWMPKGATGAMVRTLVELARGL
jgi:leucyl aminopeptidase